MLFRLKAFAAHVLLSACVLAIVLSGLFLGWYRWPGWYVTGFVHVSSILLAVDVTIGPLFTLLVASPRKERSVLRHDIAVIVVLQVAALLYGVSTLWGGRPLYYAYSTRELEAVAATQIPPSEALLARQHNPDLAPHWYSLPRWVWAPQPVRSGELTRISNGSATEPVDVTQMPRVFRPLSQAGDALRSQLGKVDRWGIFTRKEKQLLKQRMAARGLPTDQPNTLFMIGHDRPVLVVFDRASLDVLALIRAN
jgi:hypothetical protein